MTGLALQYRGEGELVGDLAVDLVGGADGDLLHIAEDVQLSQGDVGRALYLYAVARGHQVDRPYAAGTARLCTVFRAGLPELLRVSTKPFTGERSFSHAGGVRLYNAHHLIDLCRGKSRTDRRIGGNGVGGRGIGIDAVIQVAQRAQLSLKQNGLALRLRLMQIAPRIRHIGLHLRGIRLQPRGHLVHRITLSPVDLLQDQVLPLQQILQVRLQVLWMQQLAGLNGLF